MADKRYMVPSIIQSPSVDTQQAEVDTSNNLQVILGANDGIDIGDVDVASMPASFLSETEDDSIASGQTIQARIGLMYGFNTTWERIATDGLGSMNVNLTLAIPTGSNTIGDIANITTAIVPGVAATNLGKAVGSASGATDTGVAALAKRDDALGGLTEAADEYVNLRVDANGAVWTIDNSLQAVIAGNELQVDIVTGPVGAAALEVQGTAADGVAVAGDPVQVGGKDGSGNAQTLTTDTDGHLQVDILSGAGADTPTNPTVDLDNSTDTAAGASADLDSAEIVEAEKVWAIDISASVAFKAQFKMVEDGTPRNLTGFLFGAANKMLRWEPPHKDFAVHAGAAAGVDVIRATVFNMDPSDAADLHATFYYST